MPKFPAAITVVRTPPRPSSNVVPFPCVGPHQPTEREVTRLTVRREVTTVEFERRIER